MVSGEFVALLMTVALPDTVGADAGVNVTLKVAVCPAAMMSPACAPVALKPWPEMLKFDRVTFELPLFVRITFCELLLPTFIFVKVRLDELALS
jgi:hypothetical protein